ncbi:MAG: RluA family pseudouridine synthase [Actinomycetes bacterium]|nr:RluA family pseudouridine synthase [Actinomycetes bacterium]
MSEQYVEHVVTPEQAGTRLDVLVGAFPAVETRSRAARLIEEACVLVDDEQRPKKYSVQAGETVTVTVPPPRTTDLEPEFIPLDIRYEDDEIIVLCKAAGMVVHPAHGHWSGTLVNALLAHSLELGKLQGTQQPGIVHRLDKDTSGLMLAAKTDRAQARLQDAIKIRAVDRRYLALVHGWVGHDEGVVDAPIARDTCERIRFTVSDREGSRQAVTSFRVLQRFEAGSHDDGFTLVECKLFTGRTHQIRVHMRYIGHPIVGDPVYGRGTPRANHHLARQFLHSYRLGFQHPITGQQMAFADDLPADLQAVLDELD